MSVTNEQLDFLSKNPFQIYGSSFGTPITVNVGEVADELIAARKATAYETGEQPQVNDVVQSLVGKQLYGIVVGGSAIGDSLYAGGVLVKFSELQRSGHLVRACALKLVRR